MPKPIDLHRRGFPGTAALTLAAAPTITMESDANGAPHPRPSAHAGNFTGRHEDRHLTGGIGHNLPQEALTAFAQAVLDVDQAVMRKGLAVRRLLILVAMSLSALASELGGAGHRCLWKCTPRQEREEKVDRTQRTARATD